jgi:hypothetical protein
MYSTAMVKESRSSGERGNRRAIRPRSERGSFTIFGELLYETWFVPAFLKG